MTLTANERHVMEHATAWHHKNRLYRNYFASDSQSDDAATISGLVERGLMRVGRRPSDWCDYTIFVVTDAGITALGEP